MPPLPIGVTNFWPFKFLTFLFGLPLKWVKVGEGKERKKNGKVVKKVGIWELDAMFGSKIFSIFKFFIHFFKIIFYFLFFFLKKMFD